MSLRRLVRLDKHLGQAGPAEVDIQEQGSLARPGAGGGQVERRRALALAGLGAGHQSVTIGPRLSAIPSRLARTLR